MRWTGKWTEVKSGMAARIDMEQKDLENIVRGVVSDLAAGKGAVSEPDRASYETPVNRKDRVKRVALGSDHTAFEAKERLRTYLEAVGYRVADVGTFDAREVDYPDVAAAVAAKVVLDECERGIVLDDSGIGSSMACNKVRGIRAALCHDLRTAINSRERHNANVLVLSGAFHSTGEICEMAKVWLETRFAGGEHWPRVNRIMAMEREQRGK